MLPTKWKTRREVVAEAVEEFQQRLLETHGYVTLTSEPEGAEVYVDGVRAGVNQNLTTPTGLYLMPGEYRLEIRRDGFEDASEQVTLTAGQLRPIVLSMTEVVPEPQLSEGPGMPPEPTVIVQQVTTQSAPYEWALLRWRALPRRRGVHDPRWHDN